MSSMTTTLPSARSQLRQSSRPALRHLEVLESDAEVIITGCVATYYLKQLAQETVRPALGDRRLVNRVVVLSRRG